MNKIFAEEIKKAVEDGNIFDCYKNDPHALNCICFREDAIPCTLPDGRKAHLHLTRDDTPVVVVLI